MIDPNYIKALADANVRGAFKYAEALNARVEIEEWISALQNMDRHSDHECDALDAAIYGLRFIQENYPKTFFDYLIGGEEE